jgi:hypothetical protein
MDRKKDFRPGQNKYLDELHRCRLQALIREEPQAVKVTFYEDTMNQ